MRARFCRVAIAVSWIAFLCPLPGSAASTSVTITEIKGQRKNYNLGTIQGLGTNAQATVKTHFEFHDPQDKQNNVPKMLGGMPTSLTQKYDLDEKHGTTGEATYSITAQPARVQGPQGMIVAGFRSNAKVTATIGPGTSDPRMNVTVTANINDPFTFSDTDPIANFKLPAEGMDFSFSLLAGTAFPDMFASDENSNAALAESTSMTFRGRLAAGLVSDPDTFWGGTTNAVDLYTLTLMSDKDKNVHAQLAFGNSTGDFALDFRDSRGLPFDPGDSTTISSIANSITAGFVNGTVNTDLTDIFTVGFVPRGTMGAFTVGGQDSSTFAAPEPSVPEPGTATLLGLGCFALGYSWLRRRRNNDPGASKSV